MKKLQIGIIGYAGLDEYPEKVEINKAVYEKAYQLGKALAENNCIVVTGGKSGVMEAANKGCREGGGISVGVVTGDKRFTANKYVDVEVVSGMYNCGEEMCLITMCDAVIVLGGGAGTLQEITIAYRKAKPIFILEGLGGWGGELEKIKYLDQRKSVKNVFCKSVEEIISRISSLNKN
jgi:hypothetical protein